ncbi:ribonuclease H-like domain-containing protein, partial [Tanacetum coccineum]
NVATSPAPTPPLSTSHHEELIASSFSASSEAPSSDLITTSIVDPMVVAHTQAGPTSTHPMTTIAVSRSHVGMFLSQTTFSHDILSRADMDNCNPYITPVDTKSKLSSVGTPVSDLTLYR